MERNTAERAIKTEIDIRTDEKEWANSVGLCQRHKTATSPPSEGEPADHAICNLYISDTPVIMTQRPSNLE